MSADPDTARAQARPALLDFLSTIALPGVAVDALDDDDNLIEAGAIDSLSMLHVIMYLEQDHGVSLMVSGIDPGELVTLGGILRAISSST